MVNKVLNYLELIWNLWMGFCFVMAILVPDPFLWVGIGCALAGVINYAILRDGPAKLIRSKMCPDCYCYYDSNYVKTMESYLGFNISPYFLILLFGIEIIVACSFSLFFIGKLIFLHINNINILG